MSWRSVLARYRLTMLSEPQRPRRLSRRRYDGSGRRNAHARGACNAEPLRAHHEGDGLACEGIPDGYALILDGEVRPKPGDVAMIFTGDGEPIKRVTTEDIRSRGVISRVVESCVIPKDYKYLVLPNVKHY